MSLAASAQTRPQTIDRFLDQIGWGAAERHPLPGDASTRSYIRLVSPRGQRAILMNQPQAAETATCPPGASDAERLSAGYNAVARLAGADTRPFAALSSYLNAFGFSAPALLGQDYPSGLLLLEDLGDAHFAELIRNGMPERPLYEAAIDTLIALHGFPAPPTLAVPGERRVHLLAYDRLAMMAETDLLAEWFVRLASGERLADSAWADYRQLWSDLLVRIDIRQPVLTLRDYHAENLMWLPDRSGIARVGLLDFQDALAGAPAYDLVSLLEDARRDVAPAMAAAMLDRYEQGRKANGPFDTQQFRMEAAILAAQRNAKIIGIFARLWLRDKKPKYLGFLPRMWGYMEHDLAHPALAPMKRWFDTHVPAAWRGAIEAR